LLTLIQGLRSARNASARRLRISEITNRLRGNAERRAVVRACPGSVAKEELVQSVPWADAYGGQTGGRLPGFTLSADGVHCCLLRRWRPRRNLPVAARL